MSDTVTNTKAITIVGAGQAGAQAAQSLRQEGFDGRLHLIGDEPQPPYQRPPLSKKYLSGEFEAERLALLPEKFYSENAVDCLFDMGVKNIDLAANAVELADGGRVAFDKLLITTGSRSRALPLPGADLDGVYSLRSIADVDLIRPNAESGKRVIIIGGGYIGLEVAAVVRALGLEVRVIEAADRIMARTAPEVVSRYFTELHRSNGVVLEVGAGVQGIERSEAGELTVATTAGTFVSDWVLVGVGGQPNIELGQAAGLTIDNGIAVDAYCQTSSPNVYAAGDCTSFPSARYGHRIRLESVQNAIDQAKAAALSMLGKGEAYDPVPWFWSEQYDTRFQIAGLSQFADEHIVRGDPASGAFAVAHLRDSKLIALDAINKSRDYMLARRMVPTTSNVDREALADPDTKISGAIQSE